MAAKIILIIALMMVASGHNPDESIIINVLQDVKSGCGGDCCDNNCDCKQCEHPDPWICHTFIPFPPPIQYGICHKNIIRQPTKWIGAGQQNCQEGCQCYLAPDSCSNSTCEVWIEGPPPTLYMKLVKGICAPRAYPPPKPWINQGSNGCGIDCDCYTPNWW